MNFSITTVTPIGYALVCVIAAALFTWLLYRKHSFENKVLLRIMQGLRFVGLALLFFLLLSPFLKLKIQKANKPKLLLIHDISESINLRERQLADSALNLKRTKLAEKFEILDLYSGNDISFTEKNTDRTKTSLSAAVDRINEIFESKYSGAAVLVTDGIFNSGVNPLFKSVSRNIPLFTLGLGDTIQHPDAWISGFTANATAFLGNEFVVNYNLRSSGLLNQNLNVNLYEDGLKIKSTSFLVSAQNFFKSSEFVVKPKSAGVKKYEIRIQSVNGETNLHNNNENIWVNVTNTKKKIAVCFNSPHPDIGAIARSLEAFGQYEVLKLPYRDVQFSDLTDLYILHGFGANKLQQDFIKKLIAAKKPFWFILTAQCSPRFTAFTDVGMVLTFDPASLTDAQGVYNSNFSDFLMDEAGSELKNWPPLKVPNGRYQMPPMFKTMFKQKIGAIETDYPLMGFTEAEGKRQAWLFGEGIWRWRLSNLKQDPESVVFDQWMVKTVQYLASSEIKNQFRVFTEKNTFAQGENVRVYAEYLDESGNLSNQQRCSLQVSGAGIEKQFSMATTGDRYSLDLGSLPAGDYNVTAKTVKGVAHVANSKFSVSTVKEELKNQKADHTLLRQLSSRNNGKFFTLNQVESLSTLLLSGKYDKTVLTEELNVTEFIHLKWLFAVLVLVFATEWFLRKREGAY